MILTADKRLVTTRLAEAACRERFNVALEQRVDLTDLAVPLASEHIAIKEARAAHRCFRCGALVHKRHLPKHVACFEIVDDDEMLIFADARGQRSSIQHVHLALLLRRHASEGFGAACFDEDLAISAANDKEPRDVELALRNDDIVKHEAHKLEGVDDGAYQSDVGRVLEV